MTETVAVEESDNAEETVAKPQAVKCLHCGKPTKLEPGADPDWLCPKCEHYQDQTVCPTCHSVVKASLMKGSK